jgi:DNA-binding NtrC family response regulator
MSLKFSDHIVNKCLDVAPRKGSVLIIGQKEYDKLSLAKLIHDNSPLKREKLIEINCDADPKDVDKVFFGGITSIGIRFKGIFETFPKGTIIIKDPEKIAKHSQEKLALWLEQVQEQADIRIITITTKAISSLVGKGKFDEYLWEQISRYAIRLPNREILDNIQETPKDCIPTLRQAEKELIRRALIHTDDNRTRAAKILKISVRGLRNKIAKYREEGDAYFLNLS